MVLDDNLKIKVYPPTSVASSVSSDSSISSDEEGEQDVFSTCSTQHKDQDDEKETVPVEKPSSTVVISFDKEEVNEQTFQEEELEGEEVKAPGPVTHTVLGCFVQGRETDEDWENPKLNMYRKRVKGFKLYEDWGADSEFWHWDPWEDESYDDPMWDRAVLVQSIQNYREIHRLGKFEGFPTTDEVCLTEPRFGEQLIVDIPDGQDVCLGDIYGVPGGKLKIQVTGPRKPCMYLDMKNNTKFGLKGIRHLTLTNALAGWFCAVLEEGHLKEGQSLQLEQRLHPEWPMPTLANAVFGEGSRREVMMGKACWRRSIFELQDLVSLEYLINYEWKEDLKAILRRMKKNLGLLPDIKIAKYSPYVLIPIMATCIIP